jgi:hypothetical protein
LTVGDLPQAEKEITVVKTRAKLQLFSFKKVKSCDFE